MAYTGPVNRTGERRGAMTGAGAAPAVTITDNLQATRDNWKKTLARTQALVTGGKLTKKEGLEQLMSFQEKYNPDGADKWLSEEMGYVQPWAEELAQEAKTGKLKDEAKTALDATISKFETQMGLAAGEISAGETKALKEIDKGEEAASDSLEGGYKAARGEVDTAIGEEKKALSDITGAGGILDKAKAEAKTAFGEARDVYAPWKQAGEGALTKFQEAMGMGEGGGDLSGVLSNLPGFQFRMEQGLSAATKMQAARGGALGGRALQELQQVGQGVASEEFGRYLGGLSDLMGRGQQATGAISNIFAQEAGMVAGFGEMAAGFTERSVGRTSGLRGMSAGLYEQEGTNTANLRMQSAMTRANISQASASGKASLLTTKAGTVAGMEQAGQQAGTAMEFQTQMTGWQQTFQKQMAEWEAATTERIANQQADRNLFSTLLGGAFAIGGAAIGAPATKTTPAIKTTTKTPTGG